jgi:hypothetical protein
LTVASDDAPDELVISGHASLVAVARRTASRLGIRVYDVPAARALPLREFAALRRSWRDALGAAHVRPPKLPVFSPSTVSLTIEPRLVLVDGLTSCVRIRQTLRTLSRHGVRRVHRIGAIESRALVTATSEAGGMTC